MLSEQFGMSLEGAIIKKVWDLKERLWAKEAERATTQVKLENSPKNCINIYRKDVDFRLYIFADPEGAFSIMFDSTDKPKGHYGEFLIEPDGCVKGVVYGKVVSVKDTPSIRKEFEERYKDSLGADDNINEGMKKMSENEESKTRFEKLNNDQLRGANWALRLVHTSPRIRGAALELIEDLTKESYVEMDRRDKSLFGSGRQ